MISIIFLLQNDICSGIVTYTYELFECFFVREVAHLSCVYKLMKTGLSKKKITFFLKLCIAQ